MHVLVHLNATYHNNYIESMHSSMIFYDIAQHLSKMKDRVVRTWYHATTTHNWASSSFKKNQYFHVKLAPDHK